MRLWIFVCANQTPMLFLNTLLIPVCFSILQQQESLGGISLIEPNVPTRCGRGNQFRVSLRIRRFDALKSFEAGMRSRR